VPNAPLTSPRASFVDMTAVLPALLQAELPRSAIAQRSPVADVPGDDIPFRGDPRRACLVQGRAKIEAPVIPDHERVRYQRSLIS
jgi:hypothetical protein